MSRQSTGETKAVYSPALTERIREVYLPVLELLEEVLRAIENNDNRRRHKYHEIIADLLFKTLDELKNQLQPKILDPVNSASWHPVMLMQSSGIMSCLTPSEKGKLELYLSNLENEASKLEADEVTVNRIKQRMSIINNNFHRDNDIAEAVGGIPKNLLSEVQGDFEHNKPETDPIMFGGRLIKVVVAALAKPDEIHKTYIGPFRNAMHKYIEQHWQTPKVP